MGRVSGRVVASHVGRTTNGAEPQTCTRTWTCTSDAHESPTTGNLHADVHLHQRRARLRRTSTRTRTCTNDAHDASDPRIPTISAAQSSLPPRSPQFLPRQRQASTLSHREAALRPTLGDPGVSAANPGCPTHSNPAPSPPGKHSNPAPSSSSKGSDPDSSIADVHVYLVTVHVHVQVHVHVHVQVHVQVHV
jgi:hypothetical protein